MKRQRRMPGSGFTLVELLVAAGLATALAAALLALAVNVTGAWRRSAERAAARADLTRILDQVGRDLESLVGPPEGGAWLAATVQRDQVGAGDTGMSGAAWAAPAKPPGLISFRQRAGGPGTGSSSADRFGQAGVWLRFFTTEPDANDGPGNRSVPRAVAYQIVRRRVGAGFVYQLFRSSVRPGGNNSTFSAGFDLLAPPYLSGNGAEQHPGNIRRPNVRFLLARHVVDFGVRIRCRGPADQSVYAFPIKGPGETVVAGRVEPGGSIAGYPDAAPLPGELVEIDLSVRILTATGASRIAALESGRAAPAPGESLADAWWRLAEAHSELGERTVNLRR